MSAGRLVDGSGNPVGTDASTHAEIMRLLALVAVVRHDLGVTVRAVSNAHNVLAAVADGLCAVAALHGLKPTREEILDAVAALQRAGAASGAGQSTPEPKPTPTPLSVIPDGPEEGSAPAGPDASAPSSAPER